MGEQAQKLQHNSSSSFCVSSKGGDTPLPEGIALFCAHPFCCVNAKLKWWGPIGGSCCFLQIINHTAGAVLSGWLLMKNAHKIPPLTHFFALSFFWNVQRNNIHSPDDHEFILKRTSMFRRGPIYLQLANLNSSLTVSSHVNISNEKRGCPQPYIAATSKFVEALHQAALIPKT